MSTRTANAAAAPLPLPGLGIADAPADAEPDAAPRGKSSTTQSRPNRFATWRGLSRSTLASYWYKTLRLGDEEGAWTALVLLRDKLGVGDQYLLTRLLGLLVEDGSPEAVRELLPVLTGMYAAYKTGGLEGGFLWHAYAHATHLLATAPKWYMAESGEAVERLRQRVVDGRDEATFAAFRLPSWTFDEHTGEGKRRIDAGTADLRLSGTFANRPHLRERWLVFTAAHPALAGGALRDAWVRAHTESAEDAPAPWTETVS